MFTNRHEVAPAGELLPTPNSGHIYGTAFAKPLEEMAGFANIVFPTMSSAEERKRHKDRLDVMNETLSDPRLTFGQKTGAFISGLPAPLVTLAPLTVAGGLIGGAAGAIAGSSLRLAPAVETIASRELPTFFTEEFAPYIPGITAKGALTSTAIAYGAYKGAVIPEHVVEAYNKDTDKVDWNKAIHEYSNDNWGFLLAAAPFVALGIGKKIYTGRKAVLEGKALKAEEAAKESRAQEILDNIEAVSKNDELMREAKAEVRNALKENRITPKEYEFFRSYLLEPENTAKHNERASSILQEMGSPFQEDAGKLWIEILDSETLSKMKKALAEQFGSSSKEGTMSNYIVNNALDDFRARLAKSPRMLEVFNDVIESTSKNISKAEKQNAKTKAILEEHVFNDKTNLFDEEYIKTQRKNYSEETINNLIKLNKIESQRNIDKNYLQRRAAFLKEHPGLEEIYDHYTGNQLSEEGIFRKLSAMPKSRRENAPYLIPPIVKERLKLFDKLQKATDLKEITRLNQALKDIKLRGVNEELRDLYESLTAADRQRVNTSPEYLRLQELASIRDDAKHVLDSVKSFYDLKKQQAITDLFAKMVKMADSSALKFADNAKVIEHYTKRLDELAPTLKERKPISPKTLEKLELKPEEVDIINKHEKALYKDYELFKRRVDQFETKQDALNELITCTLRGLNG
jgi:hypothetical protein